MLIIKVLIKQKKLQNHFIENLKNLNIDLNNILKSGHTQNFGVKYAKYNTLLFFDADTILENYFIEKNLKSKNKRKLEIGTFLAKIDNNFRINVLYFLINFSMIIFQSYKFGYGAVGIFCDKKIHEKINGFDEKIIFAEDSDYTKRASRYGKYGIINLHTSAYPRRYKNLKIVKESIYCSLYRIITQKEIYDKKIIDYKFGKN